MSFTPYTMLAGLCIVGAVILGALGETEMFLSLVGLAGTLAGRGGGDVEMVGNDEDLLAGGGE
jgi:hypothetical protein